MFYSQWANRPTITLEMMDPVSMVETAGYVPAEEKIRQMIDAGIRLKLSRIEQFDFPGDTLPTDFNDPLRAPGLELADVSELERVARTREREVYKRLKEAKKPEVNNGSDGSTGGGGSAS